MYQASDIAICNLALAHLGQAPIVNLSPPDPVESARRLSRIYEITRDVVLRAKDWRFAAVKTSLISIADQTVPGWSYVYGYPAKCLCVRKVFDDIESENPPALPYDTLFIPSISRRVIVCNYDGAYADYTYQMENSEFFDKAFIHAFSFLLAAQVGKPLTGDDTIAKTMLQIYGALISDAGRINDIERNIKTVQTSSFEDSR
jgi:hypothetical protein